jgi:hypothetical protein
MNFVQTRKLSVARPLHAFIERELCQEQAFQPGLLERIT